MLDLKWCTERWGSVTGRDSWSERGFFWLKAEGNGKGMGSAAGKTAHGPTALFSDSKFSHVRYSRHRTGRY
jgi:hypothetical protein